MALNLKGKARQSRPQSSLATEGDSQDVRLLRDGTVVVMNQNEAAILGGRGYSAIVGSFSSPGLGGGAGSTIIDIDTPEMVLGIPSGTSIKLTRVLIEMKPVSGAADDDEIDILIAVDQDKMNAQSSGTSTVATIYNMNTLWTGASKLYANVEYSTTMTDPVLDLELAHATKIYEHLTTVGTLWVNLTLNYEPKIPRVINGPAMVCIYWGGTLGASAFCTAEWIEFPSTEASIT